MKTISVVEIDISKVESDEKSISPIQSLKLDHIITYNSIETKNKF